MLYCVLYYSSPQKLKSQLDAITCLIPLMGRPKVGSVAKQAVLAAIALRDERIEHFIVTDTNLLDNVVTELCRKYQKAVELWSTAGSAANLGKAHMDLQGILDAFLRVLRFTCAMYSASSSLNGVKIIIGGAIDDNHSSHGDRGEVDKAPSTPQRGVSDGAFIIDENDPNAALSTPQFNFAYSHADGINESPSTIEKQMYVRAELVILFHDIFLDVCHRTAVTHNSEQQVLAVQLLLRQVLQTLATNHFNYNFDANALSQTTTGNMSDTKRKTNPSLHEIASNYFIENSDFMAVMLSRSGAMSKAVVVSVLQLLGDLLSSASLSSTVTFMLGTNSSESVTLEPSTPGPTPLINIDVALTSIVERQVVYSHHSLQTVVKGSVGSNVLSSGGTCLGFDYKDIPHEYVATALRKLTSRLFGCVDICSLLEGQFMSSVLDFPSKSRVGTTKTLFLDLIMKKLGSFVSLKYEEQVEHLNAIRNDIFFIKFPLIFRKKICIIDCI
jgi:hypothetical protein